MALTRVTFRPADCFVRTLLPYLSLTAAFAAEPAAK